MRQLSASEKLAAVREVINKKRKLSSVAQKYNCSRQSLHTWLNRYKAFPLKGKYILESKYRRGNRHYKKLSWKIEKVVLDFVVKNPSLSLRRLTREVNNLGYKVSLKGVYGILARHNLRTSGLRHNFSILHPVRTLFSHEFSPAYRVKAVEEYIEESRPISEICRRWKVSRPTFYTWLTSYKNAKAAGADVVEALVSKHKKGLAHHRSLGMEAEQVVLKLASEKPEFSVHKLYAQVPRVEGRPIVGHHGIQNILERNNLSSYSQRLEYAQGQQLPEQLPVPLEAPALPRGILIRILSPFATIPKFVISTPITWPVAIPFLLFVAYILEIDKAFRPTIFFPITALTFGLLFFAYSAKYYASLVFVLRQGAKQNDGQVTASRDQGTGDAASSVNSLASTFFSKIFKSKKRVSIGLVEDLSKVELKTSPFVSVHIPIYNEKRVVERMIKACTSLKWEVRSGKLDKEVGSASLASESRRANYEVVIVDDSTDETTDLAKKAMSEEGRQLVLERADENLQIFLSIPPKNSGKPVIKLIHRSTRAGFKGAALAKALENTDRRAEYILVFDADFVPYPDTIEQFVKYFALVDASDTGSSNSDPVSEKEPNRVAAIQGYQWHVLNKSENWITRGVRSEYAGSYVVERSAIELYGGLKMIAGSVYAIRRDILDKFGWGTSITEDFELTMRLYSQGYKVIYTPYIQAPAEAVATVKRLIRQRMRWAEGHSFNIKKYLKDILRSPHLTFSEKFEFAYLAPYYLQAAFFVVGTFAWFISEAIFKVNLPYWAVTLGWSLVFTNMLALPLMNVVGLFLEQSEERDYLGALSFMILSYLVVPFQAYAAVKGFMESEEGPWFRTPKTGHVTDMISRVRLGFWWRSFGRFRIPFGKPATVPASAFSNSYESLAFLRITAQNTQLEAKNFRRRQPFLSRSILALLLIATLTVSHLALFVPQAYATNIGADYGTHTDVYCWATDDCKISYRDVSNLDLRMSDCDNATCSSGNDRAVDETGDVGWYTSIYCLSSTDCKISYFDNTNADLKFADCDDSACSTKTLTTVDDSSSSIGWFTSIYCLSSTDCKIAYWDSTNNDLKFVDCDDSACTSGNRTITTVDSVTSANTGIDTSIYCLSSTDCKISYRDVTNADLMMADCDDSACTSGNRTMTTIALTVPEFIGFLVPVAPFLPKIVRKVRDRLHRWRRAKKLWWPKV